MIEIPTWLFVLFIVLSVLAMPTIFFMIVWLVVTIHIKLWSDNYDEGLEEMKKHTDEFTEAVKEAQYAERVKKNETTKR